MVVTHIPSIRVGANYTLLPELRTYFPEDCQKYLSIDAETLTIYLTNKSTHKTCLLAMDVWQIGSHFLL